MVKQFLTLFTLLIFSFAVNAQIKIHSHNDYTHQIPFYEAIKYKTFSIEADVFVVGDSLIVAHSKKEIKAGNTLENLYLKPIATLFGTKEFYSFQLMIDFKDSWALTYPVLLKVLKPYQKYLQKGNKKITITISGNRPPDSTFHTYQLLNFDGLPNVNYAAADIQKITMISDNFASYSKWKGVGEILLMDREKLLVAIGKAHKLNKPMRFWNAPDTEVCWSLLWEMGVDIINTDKVAEATQYFNKN